MPDQIELWLPIPPSVNQYYRQQPITRTKARTIISAEGRLYRSRVSSALHDVGWAEALIGSDVFLKVFLFPADKRKRDIDNPDKALLDSLTKAEFWKDDSQVKGMLKFLCEPIDRDEGLVCVRVELFDAERARPQVPAIPKAMAAA